MITFFRYLLCLCSIVSLSVWAEVPVVDESENFALFNKQQTTNTGSAARFSNSNSETVALAHEDLDSSNNNSAKLINKLQGMQQDIQELRGQLEQQAHQLKLLKEQQLAFYKDLDQRLHTTSKSPQQTIPIQSSASNLPQQDLSKPLTNQSRANPANEQISYLAAYDLVKNKQFNDALIAMQNFVTQYPHGGYTANAEYWLGELYMVSKDYLKAIEHFDTVLKQFPSSSKAAASTLKTAYALAALGKVDEASQRLQQLLKTYPDTPAAKLALSKLKSLSRL